MVLECSANCNLLSTVCSFSFNKLSLERTNDNVSLVLTKAMNGFFALSLAAAVFCTWGSGSIDDRGTLGLPG